MADSVADADSVGSAVVVLGDGLGVGVGVGLGDVVVGVTDGEVVPVDGLGDLVVVVGLGDFVVADGLGDFVVLVGLAVGLVVVPLSGSSGSGVPRVTESSPPSTEPKTRVAWKRRVQRTGTSRTLRPVRGASTIMPSPAYIATWWMPVQLLDELKNSRSPGSRE